MCQPLRTRSTTAQRAHMIIFKYTSHLLQKWYHSDHPRWTMQKASREAWPSFGHRRRDRTRDPQIFSLTLSGDGCALSASGLCLLLWCGTAVYTMKIRYSLAGQNTRLSPERHGFKSRWRNLSSCVRVVQDLFPLCSCLIHFSVQGPKGHTRI